MTLSTIAQSVSAAVVREYSLVLIDPTNGDTQNLTAAFTAQPSSHDWQQWLAGWFGIGYQIQSQPVLVRTV